MRSPAFLLLVLLPGCVSFSWSREARFRPPPKGAVESLEVGVSALPECLDRLGAPLYVWEYKGDGAALAWGWDDVDSKEIGVSIPLHEYFAPSLNYGDEGANLRGVVLLFRSDWKLEMVRTGRLHDLRTETQRRRPATEAPPDAEAPAASEAPAAPRAPAASGAPPGG